MFKGTFERSDIKETISKFKSTKTEPVEMCWLQVSYANFALVI